MSALQFRGSWKSTIERIFVTLDTVVSEPCIIYLHFTSSCFRSSMDFSTGADRVGLFWLLEEESIFPGSSDESFVDRLFVHHQRFQNEFFVPLLSLI